MIVTTTPSVEGQKIQAYLGIVTGEAIVGAHLFKDLFASIRDIVGGRSGTYEKTLADARRMALDELAQAATEKGANAVVGVDLDYEVLGHANGMLMGTRSGRAA